MFSDQTGMSHIFTLGKLLCPDLTNQNMEKMWLLEGKSGFSYSKMTDSCQIWSEPTKTVFTIWVLYPMTQTRHICRSVYVLCIKWQMSTKVWIMPLLILFSTLYQENDCSLLWTAWSLQCFICYLLVLLTVSIKSQMERKFGEVFGVSQHLTSLLCAVLLNELFNINSKSSTYLM